MSGADTQETPRLSYSVAKRLLDCPIKAYMHHRLLGGVDSEPTTATDKGTVIESLITGEPDNVAVISAASFRTKDAQAARDDARANGLTPMLAKDYEALVQAADQLRPKIAGTMGGFDGWQFQHRVEWQSGGVECSGYIDALRVEQDAYTVVDFKSTVDAHPLSIQRTVTRYGYDIQCAAYVDAIETLHPQLAGRGAFMFIFFELSPPYCVTPVYLDGALRDLGRRKWRKAQRDWKACLEHDVWPEYVPPGEVYICEGKPWDLEAYAEEPERDEEGKMTHADIPF